MANELKPCPFCGAAATRWNTRRAAPVDGLDTVEWQYWTPKSEWKTTDKEFVLRAARSGEAIRELVAKTQAEVIIAAKDRLLSASDTVAQQLQNQIVTLTLKSEDLEADNAALTARVRRIADAQSNVVLIDDVGHYVNDAVSAHIKALETQLAAAEKALKPFADHAKERVVDEPEWRDNYTLQILVTIGELRQARTALEAKP